MMLKKTEQINQLLDFYETLLTEKQKLVMTWYYREDLSLREIAENLAISHNSVHDLLKRTENKLLKYDNQLGLIAKHQNRSEIYARISKVANQATLELLELLKEEL